MNEPPPENSRPEVTIINERRGSSSLLIAVLALVLIAVAAFWMIGTDRGDGRSNDASISAAADKVDDAADRVGQAAENAADKLKD